jgi:hypothetical protein
LPLWSLLASICAAAFAQMTTFTRKSYELSSPPSPVQPPDKSLEPMPITSGTSDDP